MPTGYTHALEEIGYDVKKWLKEHAIRAMGVCMILRDDGHKSEAEIRARLKKEAENSYARKRLAEAKAELVAAEDWTAAEWTKAYGKARAEAEARYSERLAEFNEKKRKHEQATNEVFALRKKAKEQGLPSDGVVLGTLSFAAEQLASAYSFDYRSGPYREPILDQKQEEWKSTRLKQLAKDVDYYGKEAQKESEREDSRARAYEEFVAFVDSNAGEDNPS